jgi:hypothetical protein
MVGHGHAAVGRQVVDRSPVDASAAGTLRHEAADDAQERRLAAAAGPEQRDQLARLDGQASRSSTTFTLPKLWVIDSRSRLWPERPPSVATACPFSAEDGTGSAGSGEATRLAGSVTGSRGVYWAAAGEMDEDWHLGPHRARPVPSRGPGGPGAIPTPLLTFPDGAGGRRSQTGSASAHVLGTWARRCRAGEHATAPSRGRGRTAALAAPALKMTKLAKGELCPERGTATWARASTGRGSPRPCWRRCGRSRRAVRPSTPGTAPR